MFKIISLSKPRYVGNTVNNKKNGRGIYRFSNGDIYDGNWKDNKMYGRGFYTYASGNKYVGYFKNNRRDGYGFYFYDKGNVHEGYWKNSKRSGWGTYSGKNGEKYIGMFKNDKRDGEGVKYFANGNKYIGAWKNGKMHGYGVLCYLDGKKHVGFWVNGEQKGWWREYSEDWTIREGNRVGKDEGYLRKYLIVERENKPMKFTPLLCLGKKCGQNWVPPSKNPFILGAEGERAGFPWLRMNSDGVYIGQSKKRRANGQGTFFYPNDDRYVGGVKAGVMGGARDLLRKKWR